MSDVDDLFSAEVDVAPSTASNPRLPQVIGALVVAGILLAVVVIVVVTGLSSISTGRGNAICGGEAVCSDLTLDEVRALTAIDLPAGSEVVESSYQETDDLITVTAEVLLPNGADDPFEGTGYGTISTPSLNWKLADLTVLAFYGATGEEGTLNAEAVHAVNDRVREVVLVQITRALD
jgi:hypothetical protein